MVCAEAASIVRRCYSPERGSVLVMHGEFFVRCLPSIELKHVRFLQTIKRIVVRSEDEETVLSCCANGESWLLTKNVSAIVVESESFVRQFATLTVLPNVAAEGRRATSTSVVIDVSLSKKPIAVSSFLLLNV